MTIFSCEDSVDGIFTAVYDAWDSGLGLRNVTVQTGENQNYQLFADYRQVETDHDKAAKVADTIRDKMGMEDYEILYQAALSHSLDKGEAIFGTMVLGLAVLRQKNITRNLREPCVMRVFELARAVQTEAHHYRMFVRLKELDDPRPHYEDCISARQMEADWEQGIMFCEIEPKHQVLALLGDHFSDRFPGMNFMIYDRTHRECLVHRARMRWVILQDVTLEEEMVHRYSEKEREYARLWKGFVNSIAIEERKNPRCQMNFMPKKYWKYMTEFME